MPDFTLKVTMNNGYAFSGNIVAPDVYSAAKMFEKTLRDAYSKSSFIAIGDNHVRHSDISSFRVTEAKQ
jgi:hypothetical protein